MISGVHVALITPLKEDLSIDWGAYEKHVDILCDSGVQGIVPCGSTGEFLALGMLEQLQLVECAVKVARKRAMVIAGASGITQTQAIASVRAVQEKGADGALVVTPYYIKADQRGLYHFYEALQSATQFPIIVYHNPARTASFLEIDTIRQLMVLPFIVGLKDSCADLVRPAVLKAHNVASKEFSILSGEDATFIPFLAAGGDGIISVSANVAPTLYCQLWRAWQKCDGPSMHHFSLLLTKLNQALSCASNPIPIKYACSLLHRCRPFSRLPLSLLNEGQEKAIYLALSELNLL